MLVQFASNEKKATSGFPLFAFPLFPFYLFLQRRGAGNNLDDFAGDGSLTDAIHVQSE